MLTRFPKHSHIGMLAFAGCKLAVCCIGEKKVCSTTCQNENKTIKVFFITIRWTANILNKINYSINLDEINYENMKVYYNRLTKSIV